MSGTLYERRTQLESSRAPLTLITTLEIDEIPTAELMIPIDDTTFKKVMVPTHDLESLEQLLYCYHDVVLLEAARKLNLDNAEWFDYYRDTLRGHAQITLDVFANTLIPRNRNERTFRATFEVFTTTIVDKSDTGHQWSICKLQSNHKLCPPWKLLKGSRSCVCTVKICPRRMEK